MELRVLRYFLTVAQEGNITKAADILHVTQPTLSRQLMDLEAELGTTLFIRGKRAITLTDDGHLLRQRAQEIVELAEKTQREFTEQREEVRGVVSIGCVETMGSRFLADTIAQFHKQYPAVQFDLYNGYSDDIKERLDKGLLDVGLVMTPVEISKYDFFRLPQQDIWGVLCAKGAPLARKDSVTPADLSQEPLIMPKRAPVRNEILNWLGVPTEQLHIVATHTLLSNSVLLVERGVGYAFTLNGSLAMRSSDKTKFIPLSPQRTAESVFIWKKNNMFHPAATLFLQQAKQFVSDENTDNK